MKLRGIHTLYGSSLLRVFAFFSPGPFFLFPSSSSLVFRQGTRFRMRFFSLRFSPRFLSLILMRTGLGDEPSTRWYRSEPPCGGRTHTKGPGEGAAKPPDTLARPPFNPNSLEDSRPGSRPLLATVYHKIVSQYPEPQAAVPAYCICVCGHLQYDVLLTHTSDPSLIDYTAG